MGPQRVDGLHPDSGRFVARARPGRRGEATAASPPRGTQSRWMQRHLWALACCSRRDGVYFLVSSQPDVRWTPQDLSNCCVLSQVGPESWWLWWWWLWRWRRRRAGWLVVGGWLGSRLGATTGSNLSADAPTPDPGPQVRTLSRSCTPSRSRARARTRTRTRTGIRARTRTRDAPDRDVFLRCCRAAMPPCHAMPCHAIPS